MARQNEYSNSIVKRVFFFLIPILLSVIILGTFSIHITKQYIYEDVKRSNEIILQQVRDKIELLFNEMNTIYLNFSTNPDITVNLKKIMNSNELSFNQYNLLQSIQYVIDAPANGKDYIDSIYVYFNNQQGSFLTTNDGIVFNNDFYDLAWKEEYLKKSQEFDIWTELREIKPYGFEQYGKEVVTIYRTIPSSTSEDSIDGVIILNIKAEYIIDYLKNTNTLERQSIMITDKDFNIFFMNNDYGYQQNLQPEIIEYNNRTSIEIDDEIYEIMAFESESYDWHYFSIVPVKVLYEIPNKLRNIVVLLLIMVFIVGVIFNSILVKRNYNRLRKIISILENQDIDNMPRCLEKRNDEYSYITNKIIDQIIVGKYLKVQLSERKYKLKTYELEALQSQIKPHFLYNTLETIYWKSFQFTKGPNDVTLMIEQLSDVLKYSLHTPQEQVTIRDEIKYLQSYLAIQKGRYKDKFDVIWQYDDSILEYKTIQLILQPFVENSIYHGIKEKKGKSYIKIKIEDRCDFIKFSILDTGLGMSKKKLNEIKDKINSQERSHKSIGLYNTVKRLSLIYGESFQIYIRSKKKWGTHIYFFVKKRV